MTHAPWQGWRKSAANVIRVRNSKRPGGPEVTFTVPEWQAFIAGAQAGEFTI